MLPGREECKLLFVMCHGCENGGHVWQWLKSPTLEYNKRVFAAKKAVASRIRCREGEVVRTHWCPNKNVLLRLLTSEVSSFTYSKIWVMNFRDVIFIGVGGGGGGSLSFRSCYCRLFIREAILFIFPHHKPFALFGSGLLVISNDPSPERPGATS